MFPSLSWPRIGGVLVPSARTLFLSDVRLAVICDHG